MSVKKNRFKRDHHSSSIIDAKKELMRFLNVFWVLNINSSNKNNPSIKKNYTRLQLFSISPKVKYFHSYYFIVIFK